MSMDRRQALVAGVGAAALVASGSEALAAPEAANGASLGDVRDEMVKIDAIRPPNPLDSPLFRSDLTFITKKSDGRTLRYVGLPSLQGEDFACISDAEDSVLGRLRRSPSPLRIKLQFDGLCGKGRADMLRQVHRDIESDAMARFNKQIEPAMKVTGLPTFIADLKEASPERQPLFLMNTQDAAFLGVNREKEKSILRRRLGRWKFPFFVDYDFPRELNYHTAVSDAVPRGEFIVYGVSKKNPLETGIVSMRPDGRVRLHQECREQPDSKNGYILPFIIETNGAGA